MIQLIQAIKYANQFHSLKVKPNPQLIQSQLHGWIKSVLNTSRFQSYFQPYFSASFFESWIKSIEKLMTQITLEPHGLPMGTVSVRSDDGPFQIFVILEALSYLLPHRNVVLVFLPPTSEFELKLLSELKSQLPESNQIQLIELNQDCWEFALQHPGIKSVYWNAPYVSDFKISDYLAPTLLTKRLYITKAFKNTFCVLDGADLCLAAKDLIQRIYEGRGLAPFSVSRIVVQQKIESEFFNVLKKEITDSHVFTLEQDTLKIANREKTKGIPNYSLEQITQEQGQILIQKNEMIILSNISNCSIWHQTPLNQPIAFWMDIKYPFELGKWINNIPNHSQATIWMNTNKPKEWVFDIVTHRISFNTALTKEKPQSFWTGVELKGFIPRQILGD